MAGTALGQHGQHQAMGWSNAFISAFIRYEGMRVGVEAAWLCSVTGCCVCNYRNI